jgi:hypothetical protein
MGNRERPSAGAACSPLGLGAHDRAHLVLVVERGDLDPALVAADGHRGHAFGVLSWLTAFQHGLEENSFIHSFCTR